MNKCVYNILFISMKKLLDELNQLIKNVKIMQNAIRLHTNNNVDL